MFPNFPFLNDLQLLMAAFIQIILSPFQYLIQSTFQKKGIHILKLNYKCIVFNNNNNNNKLAERDNEEEFKKRKREEREKEWRERPLHGQHLRQTESISSEGSWLWLKIGKI